jgi:hypothetical protein
MISPIGLSSLCGLPKTRGASESTPESSASRLRVELLDIDLDGEIVLGEDEGGAGERYADSKASKSGPFDSVGSTGRLIRR